MRHKILLLLLTILAAILPTHAYYFMVDGLCYNINGGGKSVTVTYQNSSIPRYTSLSEAKTIPPR